jgi:NAD(P)-dependent dehydrogenase (short-subunit alcohol dehydrogenase family)
LSYKASRAPAERLVAEIHAAGGKAIAVQADSADEAQTAAFFAEVDRALGTVTALVNNAGITGPAGKLEEVGSPALDEVLAINVRGCFIACATRSRGWP